jgi:membrane-associated phospholipid phosphatase
MRIRCLLFNWLAFGATYPLANLIAQQAGTTRSVALPFEHAIPFLPWMVVPYLSSGLFFTLAFFWVRSKQDLRTLSRRLLLATVVAGLIFALFPLRFSASRPPLDEPVWRFLFAFLSAVDKPYNQMPSLHVAYCMILWMSLRSSILQATWRTALAAWLLLVAASTIFTYQHHVLDIAGGVLLCAFACRAVRLEQTEPAVALHYLMGAGIVLQAGALYFHSWFALYLATSLSLVSLAYARGDRFFLRKKNGKFPPWVWLLYAPYLIGYLLTWQAVRFKERHHPPVARLGETLWAGRRLTNREAALLPADCVIFDLANELSETPSLRSHPYHHFPLLDLHSPAPAVTSEIIEAMLREAKAGKPIYLHCAMGYSRSKFIAKQFMKRFEG